MYVTLLKKAQINGKKQTLMNSKMYSNYNEFKLYLP